MIGIIGAMEEEVAELKKDMQIEETVEMAGMVFCKGTLGGKDVVIVRSGIGKVNAGICAQIPALTLPIPLLTITTSFPPSVPLQNTIPAISTVSSICISFFSSATSSSIAPIIPIIYLYPPVFHEFTYALL